MAVKYEHPSNVAFSDTSALMRQVFNCPELRLQDNKQDAIVYTILLASRIFDDWQPNIQGSYRPHMLKKQKLDALMVKVKEHFSDINASRLRSYLSQPETMGNELQVCKSISEFYGSSMTNWIHKDPEMSASDRGLQLGDDDIYEYF